MSGVRSIVWTKTLLGPILAIGLLSAAVDGRGETNRTLSRAAQAEPQTLDPQRTSSNVETSIEMDLFEGLTTRGRDGGVAPGVALSWEVSADGMSWTFHLRPDARWSNGAPLTAEDFVYTLRREADPNTHAPMAFFVRSIRGSENILAGAPVDTLDVVAIDPHTLRIGLARPMPLLPELLVYPGAMPVYRPDVEADPEGWSKRPTFVSNGPFMLTGHVPQVEMTLAPNPQFHDADTIALEGVRWRVVEDAANALKLYRTAEIDVAPVSEQDLEPIRKTLDTELHVVPIFGSEFLAINLRQAPLGNTLLLRRALALAIDRAVLTKLVALTGETAVCGFVPAGLPAYKPAMIEGCNEPIQTRRAEAVRLAALAGVSPQKPLKITVNYHTNKLARMRLSAIAAMWKPLGIELDAVNQEWRAYIEAIETGKYEMAIVKLGDPTGDPLEMLEGFLPGSEINVMGYTDPEFTTLIRRAEQQLDVASRNALLTEAEQRLLDAVAAIPLDTPVQRFLVNPRVKGWHDTQYFFVPSRYLSIGP